MAVDVYELLKQFINNILTDREAAAQYAEDPHGTLAAQGIADCDLSDVDMRDVVGEVAMGAAVSPEARNALQSYSSGSPAPSHHQVQPPASSAPAHQPPVEQAVQHLNYVTYVAYEGDEYITNQIINQVDNSTNIDNSTNVDIDVDGNFHGDVDVDSQNINALDGSVVNTGEGDVNAATGDGAQIIDGDNHGLANTGDGAVLAGRDIEAPVNTGVNNGILADGDVQSIVGDNNQAVQLDGSADDSVFNFGDGDVTNVSDVEVTDGAFATGGNATNVSNNELDEGSALAVGGNASGYHQETDIDTDVKTDVEVNNTDTDINAQIGGYGGNGDYHAPQPLVPDQEHQQAVMPEEPIGN
ncbi:MAG TPA: hypothetical protein VF174_03410 [Micromonosporaceae bacterium]